MGFWDAVDQLYHMQTVCTSLHTDNHTNTSSLNFLHMMPDQQCQSTEGIPTNSVKALKA